MDRLELANSLIEKGTEILLQESAELLNESGARKKFTDNLSKRNEEIEKEISMLRVKKDYDKIKKLETEKDNNDKLLSKYGTGTHKSHKEITHNHRLIGGSDDDYELIPTPDKQNWCGSTSEIKHNATIYRKDNKSTYGSLTRHQDIKDDSRHITTYDDKNNSYSGKNTKQTDKLKDGEYYTAKDSAENFKNDFSGPEGSSIHKKINDKINDKARKSQNESTSELSQEIELANSLIEQGTKILLQESYGEHGLMGKALREKLKAEEKKAANEEKIKKQYERAGYRDKLPKEIIEGRKKYINQIKDDIKFDDNVRHRDVYTLGFRKDYAKKDLGFKHCANRTHVTDDITKDYYNKYFNNLEKTNPKVHARINDRAQKKSQNESISELLQESVELLYNN